MFTHVQVQNYRSIADSGLLPIGPLTVLIGRNNSGKSALLRSIYSIQDSSGFQPTDVRIGETAMFVTLAFDALPDQLSSEREGQINSGAIILAYQGGNRTLQLITMPPRVEPISTALTVSNQDPHNLLIPVLSGRRQSYYREQATATNTLNITAQDSFLVSRIMPMTSGQFPEAIEFRRLCKAVLGINFDVYPLDQQQQIGLQVSRRSAIPLEAMGAGLSGALSLIFGLSNAEGKLFLIEEPEDDLHPKALKDLLDAIIQASERNQFIISTHSSIVLTRLGAVPESQIIHVESDGQLVPTSSYKVITDRSERLDVLQDLGYTLADLDLGAGWLIFEESSAEVLVRQHLARWFAPKLLNLRTVAARGNSRVEPLFDTYREMLLYAHLEPVYRYRAWVIVDGDSEGTQIVARLRSDFKTWPGNHFVAWSEPAFELYYPEEFKPRVAEVMAIRNRRERKAAKENLLQDVLGWIAEDDARAQQCFAGSAADAITILQSIEAGLARTEPLLIAGASDAE